MNNTPPVTGSAAESANADENPSAEEIIAELEVVAKSDAFAGAARQQRLLRHLVSKRLNGSLGDLKEYTLGVEVFDRGEDFDPRLDPIVRVEASRLRSRLQKYYEGAGSADPVRILLPRGAYIPKFSGPPVAVPSSVGESAPTPALEATAPPSRGSFGPPWLWLGAGLGLIAAAVFFAPLRHSAVLPTARRFTQFKRITNDESLCTWPTFSPDDKSIAYARRDAGTWQIYLRDLTTSAVTELTPGSLDDNTQPAWSPDGRQIAFRSERDGGGIYLLDVHSRTVRPLTPKGYSPSWAPDSKRLVFASGSFTDPVETGFASSQLYTAEVSDGKVQPIGTAKGPSSPMQPAWSPHGTRIAYWDTDSNGDRDIWTIDADGNNPPLPVTHDAWTDWDPTWTPDGKYLYFASDRGGSMNLWRIRVDEENGAVKGQPEAVTTPSSYTGWLSFAHNGKRFVYVRHTPFSELYKAPFDPAKGIDLMQRTQLSSGERSMHEPDMSPDSKWIVLRVQDPQEDLALLKADGTGFRRLTNDIYTERDPRWSPDGKEITFISNRSRAFQIWSIRPDATGLRQLTQTGVVPRAWTPDGTLLGFPSDGGEPMVLDPPRSAVKNYNLPAVLRPISWSPDGSEVVARMRSNAFGRGSLFIFTPSTQDYGEVTPNAANASTVWLDGGKQLVFSRVDGIYLADVRTHQVKPELSIAHNDIHSRFTMSQDGRTLFFVQADDEEDIWTAGE